MMLPDVAPTKYPAKVLKNSKLAIGALSLMFCLCSCAAEEDETQEQLVISTVSANELPAQKADAGAQSYFALFYYGDFEGEVSFRRLSAMSGNTAVELFLFPSGEYSLLVEPARGSGHFAVASGQFRTQGWDLLLDGIGLMRLSSASSFGEDAHIELTLQSAIRGYPLQGKRFTLSRVLGDWSFERHLQNIQNLDPRAL